MTTGRDMRIEGVVESGLSVHVSTLPVAASRPSMLRRLGVAITSGVGEQRAVSGDVSACARPRLLTWRSALLRIRGAMRWFSNAMRCNDTHLTFIYII